MKFAILLVVFVIGFAAAEGAINCTDYNPSLCVPDLIPFCLTNKTLIQGTCEAKEAICVHGAKVAASMDCCHEANPSSEACAAADNGSRNGGGYNHPALVIAVLAIFLHFLLYFARH